MHPYLNTWFYAVLPYLSPKQTITLAYHGDLLCFLSGPPRNVHHLSPRLQSGDPLLYTVNDHYLPHFSVDRIIHLLDQCLENREILNLGQNPLNCL